VLLKTCDIHVSNMKALVCYRSINSALSKRHWFSLGKVQSA